MELRTKEIVYTMLFFAAMVVLIFSFAFVDEKGQPVGNVAGGILWIAVAFAGVLGIGRAFEREREGDTMRALLLSPADRGALFLGKAIGVSLFMLIVQIAVVPMVAILFGAPIWDHLGALALLLVLATVGFAVVGSTFAAMLIRSRMREILLPVMLYPIVLPTLIAGAKGTAALFGASPDPEAAYTWIKVLVGIDICLATASLTFFESLVIE